MGCNLSESVKSKGFNVRYEYDIKLVLDVECQEIIQKSIHEIYPEHGDPWRKKVPSLSKTNPYEWIIDPIDGTGTFSHGFRYRCSSVAVKYNNEVVAGGPFTRQLLMNYFMPPRIEAAYCNNDIITVNDNKNIETSMILTGMNVHRIYDDNPHLQQFQKLQKLEKFV